MNDLFKGRGIHSLLDYNNCFIPKKNTESILLNLFIQFKLICKSNELRIVGEIFNIFDGSVSPSGGTYVIALDESHISLHSYGEEGLCAIDLFTCSRNPNHHINALCDIKKLMEETFPDIVLMKQEGVPRFISSQESSPNPTSES
jgi:S-adenosylmethionine/arginine decarboxylase-like enzyme